MLLICVVVARLLVGLDYTAEPEVWQLALLLVLDERQAARLSCGELCSVLLYDLRSCMAFQLCAHKPLLAYLRLPFVASLLSYHQVVLS